MKESKDTVLRAESETMTIENLQDIFPETTTEVQPDSELFVGEVHEELSEQQVFAEIPASSHRPAFTKTIKISHLLASSALQKSLVAAILLIGSALLFSLYKSRLIRPSQPLEIPITPAIADSSAQIETLETAQKPSVQNQQKPVLRPPQSPLSMEVAQNLYYKADYQKAYDAYELLYQGLPAEQENPIKDFLQFKMALCMKKSGNLEKAIDLFNKADTSNSPVIRVLANYQLGLIKKDEKQFLKARTRFYRTVALLGDLISTGPWAQQLQRDCHFLIAESLTRKTLLLCDADKDIPEQLWPNSFQPQPFANLSQADVDSLLTTGIEQLRKALLAPQIKQLEHQDGPARWSVTCQNNPIEELLGRFAAKTDLDIRWNYGSDPINVRNRAVNLYLPAATKQQLVRSVAGSAGLFGYLDEKNVINIYNPDNYRSLSEHIALLKQEAISHWREFLLVFHDDKRTTNAHFALGLMQALSGRTADAIAEYKLLANRFSQTTLAPYALMHSSKLKADMHDYFGARQDLKQLVEQYPDTNITSQACLYLADATTKAGFDTEAIKLYHRVYNLGFSPELQSNAALGAGKCFYKAKNYSSAAEWLTKYIEVALSKNVNKEHVHSAYVLLGKSNLAMGKTQQACDALQYALIGELPRDELIVAIAALAEGYMLQDNLIKALDTLENINSWQLSKEESVEILLIKSKVLQAMGLTDKAITALSDMLDYISKPQLKAKISFELTNCYLSKGNLELARRELSQILVLTEPGALAHETSLKLADVCLKLGRYSETISVCSQLLTSKPPESLRQKAMKILAMAYHKEKNYDKAVLALLGQWKRPAKLPDNATVN